MFNKDEFQEMMNDSYPTVRILNGHYYQGDILREVDPIAFDQAYNAFCDAMEVEQ